MVGWNQPRNRASGAADRVRVYRCVRRRSGGACEDRAVVTADAIEAFVESAFAPYVRHLTAASPTRTTGDDRAAIDAERARLDDRIRRLSSKLRDEVDEDLWQDVMSDLARRRRELHARRARASGEVKGTETLWTDLTPAERFG